MESTVSLGVIKLAVPTSLGCWEHRAFNAETSTADNPDKLTVKKTNKKSSSQGSRL